jgi:hypothetical protein
VADESPDGAIRDVAQRLEDAYRDRCTPEQVSTAVSAAFEHFKDSRIRDFVPVLAERVARGALDDQIGTAAPDPTAADSTAADSTASLRLDP